MSAAYAFVPPPGHTCPDDNNNAPSADCSGCMHAVNRFAQLFYLFLDLVQDSGDDPSSNELPEVVEEINMLGLTPTLWIHCACIAAQLAGKPLTVDRSVPTIAELLAKDPGFAAPAIDKIDQILIRAGLAELDAANDAAIELLSTQGPEGEWLAHLILAGLARLYLDRETGLWQRTIHRALYRDMEHAVGYPTELLRAARISGLILEGERDEFDQLMSRSVRDGSAPRLVRIWTVAASAYHDNFSYFIARMGEDGIPEALLDLDRPLAADQHRLEKGFLIAARMVKTLALRDEGAAETVAQEFEKDRGLVPVVILGASYFHSQVMHAAYGSQMANHRANCADCTEHVAGPSGPATGTNGTGPTGGR